MEKGEGGGGGAGAMDKTDDHPGTSLVPLDAFAEQSTETYRCDGLYSTTSRANIRARAYQSVSTVVGGYPVLYLQPSERYSKRKKKRGGVSKRREEKAAAAVAEEGSKQPALCYDKPYRAKDFLRETPASCVDTVTHTHTRASP